MIQLYADDTLVYDSRLKDYALLGLQSKGGLNKGGTATILMPPGHPAYNSFTSYRTVVTIYRDGKLRFRGRALYPTDDFMLRRTITCEGERCFLRDGVHRPYDYQDSPANIFTYVIGLYNAQVEEFKQFVVGTITVTDPNNYISLQSEEAETFADTVDKLVERCGGYIVFTTNDAGQRVINWYASVDYRSSQVIEFGSNLLDFTRTTANSDLATVIVPYGAKNETTGDRLTIESVNGGLDFIQDYDAVALRGVISKAVYWDDVTTPEALLAKAQQYLAMSKNLISSLELTAIDLSSLDKNIDSFELGDNIIVRSKPHGVHDEPYQLTEQSIDYLHPQNDRVVLGKNIASLTGADVAGDRRSTSALQRVERIIRSDYAINQEALLEAALTTTSTLIQQTSEALMLEVSEQYATNGNVESAISTTMTQLSESFEFLFTELRTVVDANDSEAREQFAEIEKYIRFEDGNIILGESGNEITLRIENDRISFLDAGAEVAYFSNKHLTVLDGTFLNSLRVGAFAFIPRDNGNLSLVKVGG
jgi:hypothetical protein